MTGSARDIEHALQRVIALGEPTSGHAGVLAGSRRAILDLLRTAPDPLSIEDIAASAGLHINTTRHHLDVLAAAGLIERAAAQPEGRGRPKARYRASSAAAAPYTDLEEQLTAALRAHTEDEVAVETARRWLASAPEVTTASDLDGAVASAVESLRAVGFDARADAIGDTIVVTDCPYASLIAEHPMICTVHAELVSGVLRRTGQPVELAGFDVWVRPGVCRARLTRPDTTPDFVARPPRASSAVPVPPYPRTLDEELP